MAGEDHRWVKITGRTVTEPTDGRGGSRLVMVEVGMPYRDTRAEVDDFLQD
jgi:hypothetical protein